MEYKWIVLTNTTLAILMASLDANIVIIALPKISSDLHASILETIWIVLSYGLVTTSGMGMFAAPNRTAVMNSVPAHRRGTASGMSTTLVTLGNILSLGLSFLIITQAVSVSDLETIFTGGNSNFTNAINFVNSIHVIFFLSAAVLLASIIPSIIERPLRPRS